MMRSILFCSVCILLTFSAFSQESTKVLFVGNSYTYFWNLPQHVALMAEATGVDMTTAQSTAGGAKWSQHWQSERGLSTRDLIREGNYNMVVLQNHSMSAIANPDSLQHFGELLAEEIRRSGAEPVLYMTWSRKWDPFMLEEIKTQYEALGKKINARVAPVGEAFQLAKQLRPELEFYADDGSHQSAIGTYLAACVFYTVLTDRSPIGLPGRLSMIDEHGEKIYINLQSDQTSLFCQKVAQKVTQK